MELELLKGAGLGPRLGIACFEYVSDDSPLSWHLSDRQMRGIKDRWRAADIKARLQSLADFFAGLARLFLAAFGYKAVDRAQAEHLP